MGPDGGESPARRERRGRREKERKRKKKGYSLTLPASHTNAYGRLSRVDCYGATGGHTVDHGWVTSHVIVVGATQCHSH
jgi:hypothetical protein